MPSFVPKFRVLTGEQAIAAMALLAITVTLVAGLVAVCARPDAATSVIPLATAGVTALASLVRRTPASEPAEQPSVTEGQKNP